MATGPHISFAASKSLRTKTGRGNVWFTVTDLQPPGLDLKSISLYNRSKMDDEERLDRLRQLKLVPTIQRLAVLEFLEETDIHPTAEQAYQEVRKHFPSISKATVYNVLDALKKAGAIRELTIAREAAHYDYNANPHPHFLCRTCGNLIDVDLPCSIRPGDEILGNLVESVNTYLYGICAECRTDQAGDENDS